MNAYIFNLKQFSSRLTSNVVFGLVVLRLCLLLAVFLMSLVSEWDMPILWMLIVLVALPLWSIVVGFSPQLQTYAWPECRELLIDIVWVGLLVFFNDGAANPFIYYYLVITALGAIILSRAVAWVLCGLCAAIYTLLLSIDVTAHFHHLSENYKSHLIGMWFNYVGSSVVLCFFLTRLVKLTRQQQRDIDIIREQNLKNEQLIGLATVSASTVHQLATPLATLNLLVGELKQKPMDTESTADINMMHEQILSCRKTMEELSMLAQSTQDSGLVNLRQLIEEVEEHFALDIADSIPMVTDQLEKDVSIHCNPLLKYALINLFNNAMSSSDTIAEVTLREDAQHVFIDIENASTQSLIDLNKRWGKPTDSTKNDGLGIGSFLANTTIEQQGGQVFFVVTPNEASSVSQVRVTIQFPKLT